jgi:hypothetical protein
MVWLSTWTSIAALWASSRIQGQVMDQLVFWISIVGAINLACFAAALFRGFAESLISRNGASRLAPATLAVLGLAAAAASGGVHGRQAGITYAHDSVNAPRVREESAALIAQLDRESIRRPLVYVTQDTWSDAAGVLLALRKRGFVPAIEPDWIFMFGPSSAATGREDAEVVIAGLDGHRRLGESGFRVVGEWGVVAIHVRRRPSVP